MKSAEQIQQELAISEVARQSVIEHDRRNKLTKTQRVGRVALVGAANIVLIAHNTSMLNRAVGAIIGKDTHTAIARRGESLAPRLRQRHEARQRSDIAPSRLRRMVNSAVGASVVATEALTRRSSKRATHFDEKSARLERDYAKKRGGGRLVAAARSYKEGRAEEKRRVQKERNNASEQEVRKYREAHPEIAERVRKEHEASVRRDTLVGLQLKREYAVNYFREQNAYSFIKAIPRRPKSEGQPGFIGDYAKLAKDTITSALANKGEDGTVPLLGGKLEQEHLAKHEKQGQPLNISSKAENQYVEGVSTALWQLGFVQIEKESDIPYSHGRFNPSIEWEKDGESVKARLPYDPSNELHQLLVPSENASAHQMIELEMPQEGKQGQQDQYLNMRIVEAPVPVNVTG